MDQGYRNLAWECVCLDDARLVKVKQLLMSWRCMPADMKNLVCWPKGSRGCWLGRLKSCDCSLKHAALCMMSYLHMTRTSTVTSRHWWCFRTALAVKLRDSCARIHFYKLTLQSVEHFIGLFFYVQCMCFCSLSTYFSLLKRVQIVCKPPHWLKYIQSSWA